MTKFSSNFIKKLVFTRHFKVCALFLTLILTFFYPQQIYAANLYEIAKEFISRVNPVYSKEEAFDPMAQIPDGATLLLRPRSEKLFFADDIYAVKSNNEIYLELSDFINILNFAIDYDDETMSGEGFFLREDWEIDFNLSERTVISRGQQFNVTDAEILEQDGLIFVKSDSLATWFGLILDVNIESQILDIESPFPFPSIAKQKRDKNFRGRNDSEARIARLPRLEQPKSNFDINNVDVSIGNRVNKSRNGDITTSETANVYAQGEILQHNAQIFASGNDQRNLQNVRAKLFKRSENPDLLGPLNARSYAIGDVNEVRIPLVSESRDNFGVRFSNSTLENTDFATTDIEGTAFPGWDVQLYRDGVLIDTQTVPSDGEYIFQEIQLFAGDNNFELFFFGPQGEVRAKSVSVPVSAALLASQNDTYEVSFTMQDMQTYRDRFDKDEDSDTINVTAKYNRLIGDNHLAYLGFRTRSIYGDRKFFLTTGSTSTLGNTLLDTNLAVDEEGNASAQAIVRQRLLGWNTSIRARINSDDFRFQQSINPAILEAAFNAQRALDFGGFRGSALIDTLYRESVDGSQFESYSVALANSLFDLSLSNRLRYDNNNLQGSATDERLLHIFSLRKNFGRFFLNLGSTYNVSPDSELDNIRAQLNYRYSNNFSTDLTFDRQFETDTDFYRLNANYIHDKFRLSPFIQYSSDEEVVAGVNLNFSMYDDPNSSWPDFTNQRLYGKGGVNAFVYHDKNGNRMFDGDDEPLEGALLESVTSKRRASTDADGYATIYDLPVKRATDVTLKDDTMPDPFMSPATEGNSIYPAEGTLQNLEFPVHMTGEIDGTVFYYNEDETTKIPAGYNDLRLIPLDDATRKAKDIDVERDGYYVAYLIKPGDYLLVPEEKKGYGNTVPEIVNIGYDGPIISDVDVQLIRDAAYVPYEVAFFDVPSIYQADEKYRRFLKVKKAGVSELSKALNSAIIEQNENLFTGLVEVNALEKDNGEYEYFVALTTENMNDPSFLHNKCREMQQNLIDCSVMINSVTYGNEDIAKNTK